MSDRIEAGTFLCIAAMNHSNIIVKNIDEDHIIPIIDKLEEAIVQYITAKALGETLHRRF